MGIGVSRACVALAFAGLPACHRAVEESSASIDASREAVMLTMPTSDSARCIWPTPATPPPRALSPAASACPTDPHPHTLDLVTVGFPEATNGRADVKVELARAPADLERGLMYRTSMEPDHGMLFDLGAEQVHQFWMHNTCISLDMIFLAEDGLIVGILENVPTLNDVARSVPCPSTHVLEMNAGWSRRAGVRAGSRVRLPGA